MGLWPENQGIVTKTVNSVYQKHGYMPAPQAPKIDLANKAK